MTTLEAIVHGVPYLVSADPFLWIGDDGLGGAPVRRIVDRGPQQHGDSDIDFRLEPRVFQLVWALWVDGVDAFWQTRAQFLRIFRPTQRPIQLRFTLDTGQVRQIDCHVAAPPTFASSERDWLEQRAIVQFRAANPTFYDPEGASTAFTVGAAVDSFVVPMVVPTGVGSSGIAPQGAIVQLGDWRDHPVITARGPITNLVVTNVSTGDVLELPGYTITGSETITIDTRPGRKSVIDQTGANRISLLSDTSDMATFAIEPDPDVPGGLNDITVTGTGTTSATEIAIQYVHRYTGI